MPYLRPRFPFARPAPPPPEAWLRFLEITYEQRWFSNGGPLVRRLQHELAARDRTGGRAVIAVASGTAGLVAALLALDIRGPVAVPAFTFPASAHAIALAGCVPVLCDADPDTWELAPVAAERAVRRHGCVAIMHVRSFGLGRDLMAIEAIAGAAGIPLVVDSAAGFGGVDTSGAPIGRAGDVEVFSFHATKVFATGEGGAVVAAPDLAERVRHVSNFSLQGTGVTGPGLNAKMSETTAAVALAMLERLDDHIAVRRRVVKRVMEAVVHSGFEAAFPVAPGRPPWQALPLLVAESGVRDRALIELLTVGVEARPYYAPGLQHTVAFAANAPDPLPVTDDLAGRMLCLPLYSGIEPSELDQLSEAVCSGLSATRHERRAHGVPGR